MKRFKNKKLITLVESFLNEQEQGKDTQGADKAKKPPEGQVDFKGAEFYTDSEKKEKEKVVTEKVVTLSKEEILKKITEVYDDKNTVKITFQKSNTEWPDEGDHTVQGKYVSSRQEGYPTKKAVGAALIEIAEKLAGVDSRIFVGNRDPESTPTNEITLPAFFVGGFLKKDKSCFVIYIKFTNSNFKEIYGKNDNQKQAIESKKGSVNESLSRGNLYRRRYHGRY